MLTRFLFAIFVLLTAAFLAPAQDGTLKDVRGTITQLDLKTGAVTIKPLSSDIARTLSLASQDVAVTNPLGDKVPLANLRDELRVTAKVRGEDEIVAIRIDGPYLYGLMKEVDVANRRVTFKEVLFEKTITVPASAKVVVADIAAKLDDFKVGDPIQVLYAMDKTTILQVQTGKGTQARDKYLRLTRSYGILAELDRPKRQAQIFVQSVDSGIMRSFEISPDASLRLMYHFKPVSEVGLDQFDRWAKVHYVIDRDTGRIINIDADLPVMTRRKVDKIDAEKITFQDDMKEKTLPLAADLKVLTPRGDGKRSDIAVGRIVNCALSLDRTKVMVVYLWDQ